MKISSLDREFHRFALAERGLKPKTLRDILSSVRRLCVFNQSEELKSLSTSAIRSFLYYGRLDLGWCEKTFKLHWQYLKTYFGWCVSSGYLSSNPVLPIEKPRLPQRLPRCLSREDAQRILYSSANAPAGCELLRTRREAIVSTFLMTGIRRHELLSLRWTDLDLKSGTLIVRGGKGSKDRSIPLHPRLLPVLRRYLDQKKMSPHPSEWIFSSSKSAKRLTEKNLYAILQQVVDDSRVKFTPHMLRHTLGRELVEADFNVYKLKEILGHANVTTTQIYVSLSQQSIRKSFEDTKIY